MHDYNSLLWVKENSLYQWNKYYSELNEKNKTIGIFLTLLVVMMIPHNLKVKKARWLYVEEGKPPMVYTLYSTCCTLSVNVNHSIDIGINWWQTKCVYALPSHSVFSSLKK